MRRKVTIEFIHSEFAKENYTLICSSYCGSCNAKANYDREWHKLWYQAILNKRYGYIYNKKIKNNKGEVNYVRNK